MNRINPRTFVYLMTLSVALTESAEQSIGKDIEGMSYLGSSLMRRRKTAISVYPVNMGSPKYEAGV